MREWGVPGFRAPSFGLSGFAMDTRSVFPNSSDSADTRIQQQEKGVSSRDLSAISPRTSLRSVRHNAKNHTVHVVHRGMSIRWVFILDKTKPLAAFYTHALSDTDTAHTHTHIAQLQSQIPSPSNSRLPPSSSKQSNRMHMIHEQQQQLGKEGNVRVE